MARVVERRIARAHQRDGEPGLLHDLAQRPLVRALAGLDMTAGQVAACDRQASD